LNRKKFVEDYAYRIDEKAAWRVAKIVDRLIKSNN